MTDDRRTDQATEKCVGIGGIAIPPNNDGNVPVGELYAGNTARGTDL